jgi:CubicO group peptidase (beta-lactamase class C family)
MCGRFSFLCGAGVAVLALSAAANVFAAETWPGQRWNAVSPADAGMDAGRLVEAREYALVGGGSGYITRHGKLVMAWGDPKQRYDLKSTTKSIGVTALGLALADGKLRLSDTAIRFEPQLGVPPESNRESGWLEEITIQHLATQTAGFEKPGGYEKLLFRPGTKWHYSDGGPNWLADCITRIYRRDLEDLLFERVFTPIGITREDLRWRPNAYRDHRIDGVMRREFGAGVHANASAMARIGYLYLRRGTWAGEQLIPAEFVDKASSPLAEVVGLPEHNEVHGNASDHYGLLWWNNADGALEGVPTSTYWSWGLYDSLIVVMPELDVVVARAGRSWQREDGADHYDVLGPFLRPIVQAAAPRTPAARAGADVTN